MGFKDADNLVGAIIFQARRFEFSEGWVVAVNAIDDPESSMFRNPNQIPLPNDPLIEAPT